MGITVVLSVKNFRILLCIFSAIMKNGRAYCCLTLTILNGLISALWRLLTLGVFFYCKHATHQYITKDPPAFYEHETLLFISCKKKKNQEQGCWIKGIFTVTGVVWLLHLAGVVNIREKEKAWIWLRTWRGNGRGFIGLLPLCQLPTAVVRNKQKSLVVASVRRRVMLVQWFVH